VDPSGDGGGGLTAAALLCGSCGAQSSPTAKFCGECGTRLTQVIQSAEYKQVTVLFADVVHSMDIAAAVGAERLREIMTELVNRAAVVVQRYGGTVDKFTGDGIMAIFGAPVSLEDHAVRACLAALGVQEEAKRLAVEVQGHDGVTLQLRVGLNSGAVIAGEIGSGRLGYTAIGEQVGMAQRMESAAPPGEVMVSDSTVRLVEHATSLAEAERVHIKGADVPVVGRRLLGVTPQRERIGSWREPLVGRELEVSTITGLLDRSMSGRGCVVCVAGPAGIGKTRLVGEAVQLAKSRDFEVFSTFCESHATDIAFRVVTRLMRAAAGVMSLDDENARARVRERVPDADEQDLLLVDDLLGIADPDVELPRIDPDARRRRLTALANAVLLARTRPALYVIEDAHWIDEVSESMLADFFAVIPQTPSMVVITYRPEYEGTLTRMHGAQTIALAPLSDSESSALIAKVLGPDSSVSELGKAIMARAAGNPFFAQEMIRDLAERGVLQGTSGSYVCHTDVAEVSVPATLQAAIGARIDRLPTGAKKTINAAAVIGLRFSASLLTVLEVDPVLDDLVQAELIDQVRFTPRAEYAFRHPLIRAVAYESQLKSDRAQLHRRLAAAIESRDLESVDENAALIAEHLEAAGALHAAFDWHMRAGAWAANRDIAAARLSWERARHVADALPGGHPDRLSMRIAPRTLLCASAWRRFHDDISARFEELRELCAQAGEKASLAVGMAGMVIENMHQARIAEASRLASECMGLVESIGDPTLIVELSFAACVAKIQAAEWDDALRWSQSVIELADRHPANANVLVGSPVAAAFVFRGVARWRLGRVGWREDLDRAVSMTRTIDPVSHAVVIGYKYAAISFEVLQADDAALAEIGEALQVAERSSDDIARALVRLALGMMLTQHDSPDRRRRGYEVLAELLDMCVKKRFALNVVPSLQAFAAYTKAADGDLDGAIVQLRSAADDAFASGNFANAEAVVFWLVDKLLARGDEGDVDAAEAAVDRLAAALPHASGTYSALVALRMHALVARARGDEPTYRELVERYRGMAKSFGLERSMAWAEAMP
jgi:class 3 adenylate cyclase